MPSTHNPTRYRSKLQKDKRRAAVERMAVGSLSSVGSTVADTIGSNQRQRLVWLSLLAMPLLFPLTLPGMATAVGVLCLLVAWGLCVDRLVPLPSWLSRLELTDRIKALLSSIVSRGIRPIAWVTRPRLLFLTQPSVRIFNGLMLSVAGLSMVVPVPIISFDNVLPALAIVLIAWGLRLRDGLLLLAGYLVTLVAVISVMLLWWGGALVVTELLSFAGQAFSH